MNRPFYAFGILLALLVLATLGVSSSGRSTQVRVLALNATKSQLAARRCGSGTFVIVLSEHRAAPKSCQITSTCVELIEEVVAADGALNPMDCRSHGDPTYDYAVYGDLPTAVLSIAAEQTAPDQPTLDAEELIGVFRTLANMQPENRVRTSLLRRWFAGQPRPFVLGLKNWAIRQFERMPLSWLLATIADRDSATMPAITWSDYSDFADGLVFTSQIMPQPAKVRLVAEGHVQSGHWLLHSAASSLNHLALLLQAAADRLHQPTELVSTQ